MNGCRIDEKPRFIQGAERPARHAMEDAVVMNRGVELLCRPTGLSFYSSDFDDE
jgi:hypothetical protein